MMVYHNPYIPGQYNPLYTVNNQVFFIAHMANHNIISNVLHPKNQRLDPPTEEGWVTLFV